MQIFFSENINTNVVKFIKFSLLSVFLITCFGCSGPKIKVSNESTPVFHFSGDNEFLFFQISDDSGAVWKIQPKTNSIVRLKEINPIKYGELPSDWKQVIPQNSTPPPPLVEGKKYEAFAVILGADVVRVHFSIKEGKVVELPNER